MYKKGGKKPKSSWMKESSEIKFGNGGADKPPFKFRTREEILNDKKRKVKEERESILKEIETFSDEDNIPGISGSSKYQLAQDRLGKLDKKDARYNRMLKKKADKKGEIWAKTGGADKKKSSSFDLNNDGKTTFADVLEGRLKGKNKKKTGGKSMEPGGGGRFAAMVSNLKKKGKSEDSAKKIAAAIGRKKYGKSKFQEMAAKGKKGLGGMSDSTSANEAGMEMMEAMGPKKPKSRRKKRRNCSGSGCFNKANERSGMIWQ